MTSISDNLAAIEVGIDQACEKAGRDRDGVQLIAVSKTKPIEQIEAAFAAGQCHFGENKVQELMVKQPAMPSEANWHLIGHLQKNKIRKAIPHCDLLHTIDSVELATQVDRISGELQIKTRALLQVNISHDEAKYGFASNQCQAALEKMSSLENLHIEGLMTIPEFNPDPEATREHFANLRNLRDQLQESCNLSLPELSMGMSHDYMVAVEEGATLVRVGSAIFGKRD